MSSKPGAGHFTVHDITHLDALWDTADTIAGESLAFNPAEAFVFGCAVLLHDAGMALAAYPNGIDDLRDEVDWRDTVAALLSEQGIRDPERELLRYPGLGVEMQAIPSVLRLRHATQARNLPSVVWPLRKAGGGGHFLIEDTYLRAAYGDEIGRIAESHGKDIVELPKIFTTRSKGALPGMPADWTVDPLTLACLLRCADAAHIDARRAPRFLRALLKPTSVSDDHWNFQEKMLAGQRDDDALVYTSGEDFAQEDAPAWWLAFDTIGAVDRELKNVDELLDDTGRPRFAAQRVRGAQNAEELAKHIRPDGKWRPIDASIKITDISRIIQMFGGEQLYGKNPAAALRELIANAADAVRARRIVENRLASWGTVTVRATDRVMGLQQDRGWWLQIEDNGVGMSERMMSTTLLDFGRAFWGSEEARIEFPGLQSRGMKPIGKFGIGFFSCFMLGKRVLVTSQRYDCGDDTARTLEFSHGLATRPILRAALPDERPSDRGTRIAVQLDRPPHPPDGILAGIEWITRIVYSVLPEKERFAYGRKEKNDTTDELVRKSVDNFLPLFLGRLCPGLDVDLLAEKNGQISLVVTAHDWKQLSARELTRRITGLPIVSEAFEDYVEAMIDDVLDEDGTIIGRIAALPSTHREHHGVFASNGLFVADTEAFFGIMACEVGVVSRDTPSIRIKTVSIINWANRQVNKAIQSRLPKREMYSISRALNIAGVDFGALPIFVTVGNKFMNIQDFTECARDRDEVILVDMGSVLRKVPKKIAKAKYQKAIKGQIPADAINISHAPNSILRIFMNRGDSEPFESRSIQGIAVEFYEKFGVGGRLWGQRTTSFQPRTGTTLRSRRFTFESRLLLTYSGILPNQVRIGLPRRSSHACVLASHFETRQ